jgi:ACT domain-containing protein
MMMTAELYVKDLPGQLVGSLEPISLVDGNIMGVVHDREQIVNDRICINVTFEVASAEALEKLKTIWKQRDVSISKMGTATETFTMVYMLIGDMSASYVENLIDEAGNIVEFDAVDVRFTSKTNENKRTAMLTVKVHNEDDLEKLDKFLVAACREGALVYVRGV